ncbi:unnamed protein product [Mytilus coruscus]|uniref:Uncharacterized protein n=1 Tax=Mytilus coruscus TaxID=42192 RepID=A0A6J8DIC4_MYTCO|nr:unnamed protein product [Mytilus coruscus]
MRFTDNFSLFNWLKLPENEKQSHKLQDCSTCLTTHGSISSLHKSYSHASSLVQPCKDLVNNINEIIVSPSSSIGKKTVQNVIKVLEPIIETQYNINFKKTLAEVMNMSPRESVVEKNNKIMTSIRETTQQIAESKTENNGDVQNLLASGKSFLQYERERLQTCYVTTDQAERQADDLQTKLASDILNHTYISFMVSFIYDHANFLTNEEFRETYPKKKPVDVQAVVERPNLYIFGQSGSKNTEQVSYTPTRTEDLEELRKGIIFDGIPYTFQLRFFQRRWTSHDSLRLQTPSDLEDRRAVFLKGESLVKIKQGNINPFQNLTKDELIEELECRVFDTFRLKTKARLQEEMSDLLHGISRPPALLLYYPEKSLTESNISCYEVLPCEPLHDISNVVQNIIQELPHHVKQNSTKLELENFVTTPSETKIKLKDLTRDFMP